MNSDNDLAVTNICNLLKYIFNNLHNNNKSIVLLGNNLNF